MGRKWWAALLVPVCGGCAGTSAEEANGGGSYSGRARFWFVPSRVDVDLDTGTSGDPDERVDVYAVELEGMIGGVGVGARGVLANSSHDLFEDDPFTNTSLDALQGFLHLTAVPQVGPLHLPIRFGLAGGSYRWDRGDALLDEGRYAAAMLAVEFEPELWVLGDRTTGVSVYARGFAAGGVGDVRVDTIERDLSSDQVTVEAGMRFTFEQASFGVGWFHDRVGLRPDGDDGGFLLPDADIRYEGVLLSFGAVF